MERTRSNVALSGLAGCAAAFVVTLGTSGASATPAGQVSSSATPSDGAPAAEEVDTRPNVVVPIAHDLGLMVVMRTTETFLWPDPFARTEHFGAHYEEAFTQPPKLETWRRPFEWDGDPWWINSIGHGLFGSELYLRARQCHLGWLGSLAMAAAGSTLWEYGFEANGVRPSGLDLVWTPLAGLALGEARFAVYRAAGDIRSPGARAAVRAIFDPLGEAERAIGTRC